MKLSTKYLTSYEAAAEKWYNSPRHQAYHNEFVIEPLYTGTEQHWEPALNKTINTRYNKLGGQQ